MAWEEYKVEQQRLQLVQAYVSGETSLEEIKKTGEEVLAYSPLSKVINVLPFRNRYQ